MKFMRLIRRRAFTQMQMAVLHVVQKLTGGDKMAVHRTKTLSNAARTLAKKSSTKSQKSKASRILNEHKNKEH